MLRVEESRQYHIKRYPDKDSRLTAQVGISEIETALAKPMVAARATMEETEYFILMLLIELPLNE